MSSSSNSAASLLAQELLPPQSFSYEQLVYVPCNICDTILAVSVPCSFLFKTVSVRCGHCSNLLAVNMSSLVVPSATQLHIGHHSFFPHNHQNLLEEIASPTQNYVISQANLISDFSLSTRTGGVDELSSPLLMNRPPEKRQRVPSAYNRFIKDEIRRIKAGNPDISHREAFSAAAKNWAHFPHIHFGLKAADQTTAKKTIATVYQQENTEDILKKDSFLDLAPHKKCC